MKPDKQCILVVDDNQDVLETLGDYLESEGFRVSMARDAEQALQVFNEDAPDLAILDVLLGNSDGFTLCREIQRISDVPVIFLSGKGEDTERIVGLEIGADDYIAKPFNPRELLARIRAVLRRSAASSALEKNTSDSLDARFGPWQLDVAGQKLISESGATVPLSTGEARLLKVFLENPNTVLSRDELLEKTQRRNASMFDRSIDNYVSRIRKKIEEDPSEPRILKTYWGGGYALYVDTSD